MNVKMPLTAKKLIAHHNTLHSRNLKISHEQYSMEEEFQE